MFRFDSDKGFFLYPNSEATPDTWMWLNQGLSYENNVNARNNINGAKRGLTIPFEDKEYEIFKQEIKLNEKAFIDLF
jgi:hypothetical protein